MIEFLLNEETIRLREFRTDVTLLEYLREQRRRTGTKEGCASGDCGACTVVVAEADGDGALRYRSVNSCITFLGAVHGRQVITVEDLADGDEPHPVQRAMIESHGSQCGFCTPGFVMSLFARYKQGPATRTDVETALAGNLCRCTGYRPIVEAGTGACASPQPDRFSSREGDVAARLAQIDASGRCGGPDGFFEAPSSLDDAARALLEHPEARPFCGATDLALEVTQQCRHLPRLVYLGNVPELNRVTKTDEALIIGAAARYTDFAEALIEEYPDLDEVIQRLGSVPIRNQGSIGGNIANASPIGDMPPVLIALDASLSLRRGEATRRVSVESFFTGYRRTVLEPGEFVETVIVPRARPDMRLVACKNSKRFDDDISTVLGIFALTLEDGRVIDAGIAFGGMAATPKRAALTERAMRGQTLRQAASAGRDALADDFEPIDDVRASAAYRLAVARGLLERACLEASDDGAAYRVSRYAD